MPSSYTGRDRFEKQFVGENINTWGDRLNNNFDLIDVALDGLTAKVLTGPVNLTSANGAADEARARILRFTGTGAFTVTIPSVEKQYFVWNDASGAITVTTGAGTTAVVGAGEIAVVICDGSNVKRTGRITGLAMPSDASDAASKAYVDAQTWAVNTGILPGQPGSAGKFLTTDGTTASWAAPTTSQISDFAAERDALKAFAIAAAISL